MNGQLSNRTKTSEDKMSPYEIITTRRDHLELCSPFNPLYEEYIKDFKKINYLQEPEVWKSQYYKYFLGNNNAQDITNLVANYLESLVFNLKYYLIGCPSWYWFYKYRMSPIPSDVVTILKLGFDVNQIRFKKSIPYTPFQQLSLILPPSKFNALPKDFKKILDDPELKEFYPKEFRVDAVQGIKYIYSEAILPEIETDKLLAKVIEIEKNLSPTEKKRDNIKNKPYEMN
jgi:5'-3' exonuclease